MARLEKKRLGIIDQGIGPSRRNMEKRIRSIKFLILQVVSFLYQNPLSYR